MADVRTSHVTAKEGAVRMMSEAPALGQNGAPATAGVRAPFDFCTQAPANCQPPMTTQINANNLTNFVTMEDTTLVSQTTLTNVCFWGLYFNNTGLGATDDFLVVVYQDDLGLPGAEIAGCVFDQAMGQITVAQKGNTGRLWFGRNEFEFSLNLSGSSCVIPANTCVWLQISDALTNGDSLFWINTETANGDGRFFQDGNQDGIAQYSDLSFGADLSFCAGGILGDTVTTCALPQCEPNCPAGARDEAVDFGVANEVCGGSANDGCNSDIDGDPNTVDIDPNAFGLLNLGDTVCGTTWGDGGTRDTDWYLISLTDLTVFSWTVESAIPGNIILISDSNPADGFSVSECAAAGNTLVVVAADAVGPCGGPISLNANLDAGSYVCFVGGPTDFTGFPCGNPLGNRYVATADGFTPCFIDCPPGGLVEQEFCGDDLNGGCNNDPGFEIFDPIAVGDVACGSLYADQNFRDTDWYQITLAAGSYSADLTTELPTLVIVQAADCNATTDVDISGADICTDGSSDFTIATSGNYYVIVLTGFIDQFGSVQGIFNGFPCNTGFNDYTLSIRTGCPCVADVTGDCLVGLGDLGVVFGNWSPAPNSVAPGTPGDLNGDLSINLADLGILFGDWGCQG